MQSLAAGAFERRFQPLLLKPLPQILRRQLERLEWHIRGRVQIEDHAVGIIDRVDRGAPGMDLDCAHLDHLKQAFYILYVEILVLFPFVPELKRVYVRPEALARIAL